MHSNPSSFNALGLLPELLKTIEEQGYQTPSPIQSQAFPPVLNHQDVMAAAQTGTGKTAGFTLPILQNLSKGRSVGANRCRALVLTPTRELAAQVGESVETYGKYLPLSSAVVFGGVKINPQMQKLRRGADILVATPGRLLDLASQNAIRFDQVEVLVLDEADRMLDMGFIHDIKKVLAKLPPKRQNLLFSATFSPEIRALARNLVNNPVEVSVTPPNQTARKIEQQVYPVNKSEKSRLLCHLIKNNDWHQVLVFTRTKHGANRLTQVLEKQGIKAAAIHGNKSQGARTRALAEFKSNDIQALVATDIAARGLDIEQLPQVVNFDLPNVAADYVHRIGRTGRAGATGHAVSLVAPEDFELLESIETLIQELIPREEIDGFTPSVPLKTSVLKTPKKPKKPKKPKVRTPGDSGNQKVSHGPKNKVQAQTTKPKRRWRPKKKKPAAQ